MSAEPSITHGAGNIPHLPNEIILQILKFATEDSKCLVHELSRGETPCEGLGDHSTVIYTRGYPNRNGEYSRGTIEVLPLQHRCLTSAPIKNDQDIQSIAVDPSWEEELYRHRLRNQVHVYDRDWRPDLRDVALEVARNIDPSANRLDQVQEGLMVLDTRILDDIPFPTDIFGGIVGPNARAWAKKVNEDDTELECQHLQHLMMRTPRSDRWAAYHQALMPELADMFAPLFPFEIRLGCLRNYDKELLSTLDLEWPLFSNLETLHLNLYGLRADDIYHRLQPLFQKMALHLRLETLVLFGVPCKMDYRNGGDEVWVAKLEDREIIDDETDMFGDPVEFPSQINILKHCLRPGGQIHFIYDAAPWSSFWDGPDDDVFALEDDGEIREVVAGKKGPDPNYTPPS
ncbi:hypothetical protein FDECE_7331 [Fusarium decemcellulare]|nr:hypothetical protein FDECE_7331 [Fusarium decemcellulare]